jgi:hypothetical protein
MINVTLFCAACSCYFDTQAFEPADLKDPICDNCTEQARECAHENVRVECFDAGRCIETGYVDAGEMIICRDCGFQEVA